MTPTRKERRYWLWHGLFCAVQTATFVGLAVGHVEGTVLWAVLAVIAGWASIGSVGRFVLDNFGRSS